MAYYNPTRGGEDDVSAFRGENPKSARARERRALTFLLRARIYDTRARSRTYCGGRYLRLKQIKRYQAFRLDDKEHRGDAEASRRPLSPRGDVIMCVRGGCHARSSLFVMRRVLAGRLDLLFRASYGKGYMKSRK